MQHIFFNIHTNDIKLTEITNEMMSALDAFAKAAQELNTMTNMSKIHKGLTFEEVINKLETDKEKRKFGEANMWHDKAKDLLDDLFICLRDHVLSSGKTGFDTKTIMLETLI